MTRIYTGLESEILLVLLPFLVCSLILLLFAQYWCTVAQVKEHFRCPIYLRGTDQIQHYQNTMPEMEMFHRCAVKDNNYLHDFHIS